MTPPLPQRERGNVANVFITGGAGFLGRAYLRWARVHRPDWQFTIFSRDEGKHARCRREFSGPQYRYVIGDIRDQKTVELAVAGHDTVIHAAAFKYVPQGETHGMECMAINAEGSQNVGWAAIRQGVARVVGISTDKACSPINNYGLSKMVMERYFQEFNAKSDTRFNLVRYGNVVASTGSVIPVFKRQLADQGFVTLTSAAMTRFWLTVEEGVALVNAALVEPQGGTTLIGRCPSISMGALAQAVAGDRIKVIGFRNGEKLHESLVNDVEGQFTEPAGPGRMRLYPMARLPLPEAMPPYSSDRPDHILTYDELNAMIQVAPE